MSFWYPRLNSVGDVVGGNGVISLRTASSSRDITSGHSPQWMSDALLLVGGRTDGTVLVAPSGALVSALGYDFSPRVGNVSGISAGQGHWAGWNPGSHRCGLV
jgi:hypothetical protein